MNRAVETALQGNATGGDVSPLREGPCFCDKYLMQPRIDGLKKPLLSVLYENEDVLVVNKPAGLVCHPTKGAADSSLIGRIRLYLGPSNTSAHLVNRLDRETSGVTLIAKNAATAGALGRAFELRQVKKWYWAIVHGHVCGSEGIIDAPLGRDDLSRVAIKNCVRPDGASSVTGYEVLDRFETGGAAFSWLRVEAHTGRKHQIRIHLAHAGHPIVGDKIYGGDENQYLAFIRGELTESDNLRLILPFQALHAWKLEIGEGDRRETYTAEPESWFLDFLDSVGGRKNRK